MKFSITFMLVILATVAVSQIVAGQTRDSDVGNETRELREVREIDAQVERLMRAGDVIEATKLAEQAIQLVQRGSARGSLDASVLYLRLARLYRIQGRLTQAIPPCKKILEILEESNNGRSLDAAFVKCYLGELYRQLGKLSDAEQQHSQSLAIREQLLLPNHPDIAESLNNLGLVYCGMSQFDKAEPMYVRALAIRMESEEAIHPTTGTIANNLAGLYFERSEYPEAERLFLLALSICEKSLPQNHPEIGDTLSNLASVYRAQGRYDIANPMFERALAICKQSLPSDHIVIARILNNQAICLSEQHRYGEARSSYERALAIQEKLLPPDHLDIATSLSNIGQTYRALGDVATAQNLYLRALAICEKSLPGSQPQFAVLLNNIAELHRDRGRFEDAKTYYDRALQLLEESLSPDHELIATTLNNIAGLHELTGKYSTAEQLYGRVLQTYRERLPPTHPAIARTMNNLAAVYNRLGQSTLAAKLYRTVLKMQEESLGRDHPNIALTYNNLGYSLSALRQYPEAEESFTHAIEIYENSLPPNHPDLTRVVDNLAELYRFQGQFEKAEPLYLRALEACEKTHPEHRDTARTLNNLARMYQDQGQFEKADQLSARSITIYDKLFEAVQPEFARCLSNRGGTNAALGEWTKAAELFDRSRRGRRTFVSHVLPALDLSEQRQFVRTQDTADLFASLSLGLLQTSNREIARYSASWLANGKAIALEAASHQAIQVQRSQDPKTAELVNRLREVRNELANRSQLIPRPNDRAVFQAEKETLQLEEWQLVRKIGGQLANLNRQATWVEVELIREHLTQGSRLVDIARFQPVDFGATHTGNRWQPERYVAWIIPPNGEGEIAIVDLGLASDIDAAVQSLRSAIDVVRKRGFARDDHLHEYFLASRQVVSSVLDPIQRVTGPLGEAVKELAISPDGALWLLPWQALSLSDDCFLIERCSVRLLSSARDLVPEQSFQMPNSGTLRGPPVILADPDFDLVLKSDELENAAGNSNNTRQGVAGRSEQTIPFSRLLPSVQALPGTRPEAESAQESLGRLYETKPIVFLGKQADEQSLKRAAVSPVILLLATHSYFLPDKRSDLNDNQRLEMGFDLIPIQNLDVDGEHNENPLLRCGLLLAGVNTHTSRLKFSDNDGILTGAEIIGLDLQGTDLVILSACDTGLGDLQYGEGVAGLRQAFQIAGAGSVISTLWKVPDEESSIIMQSFYAKLAEGLSAAQALNEAQLAYIQTQREMNKEHTTHPYFWAAYTMTGK